MDVLTKTALGAVLNRLPNDVELFLQKKQTDYLAEQYLGSGVCWDSEFMNYKDGSPVVVSEWLKGFEIEKSFDPSVSYVLAALLHMKVTFIKDAEERYFGKDGVIYKRAYHDNAYETEVDGLFELRVHQGGECGVSGARDLRVYVSKESVELGALDNNITSTHRMDLHIPYIDAEVRQTIPEMSGFTLMKSDRKYTVSDTELISMLEMDNKGARVRQAALLSAISASAGMPRYRRHPRVEVFDSSYVIYFQYKNNLMFAARVNQGDFVQGNGKPDLVESRKAYTEKLW